MILKKPYAIFIKYFKIFHFILVFFLLFVLYRSYSLYNFFRIYSIDYRSVMSSFSSHDYLNIIHFVVLGVVIAISGLLLAIMIYKDKPKKIYIYNLLLYILIFILYLICDGVLDQASSTVLNIKISKAFRDLMLIAVIFQINSVFLTIIRATGFDIKHFDFGSDLQELDISERDSEEIEVDLEFDQERIFRNVRKNFRFFKYFYFEHKFIINIFCLIIIGIGVSFFLYRNKSYSEYYKLGEEFSVGNYTFTVLDSYLLDSDVKGNKLIDDGVILAVRVKIKGYGNKLRFNTGMVSLKAGDLFYNQYTGYARSLSEMGTLYTNQYLSVDYTTYMFNFVLSNDQAKRKTYLKINDFDSFINGVSGVKNDYVRLKPIDLRNEKINSFSKKMPGSLNFEGSFLGNSSLSIDSFEVNNRFSLDYNYCYSSDNCALSKEYIIPKATGNYLKSLIKLSGDFSVDDNLNSSVNDLYSLLNKFGYINYKIDDKAYSKKINTEIFNVSDNSYYIEVPYEVKDASNISFDFKIYDNNYTYILK